MSYEDHLLHERQVKALEEIAAALRDVAELMKANQSGKPGATSINLNVSEITDTATLISAIDRELMRRNRPALGGQ